MFSLQTYKDFYESSDSTQAFYFTPLLTRQFITQYLLEKKKENPNYNVIDIGSGADFWTKPFADVTVDFYMTPQGSKQHFEVNLERESSWQKLLDYVEENEKFDFCICSHTLEDLYYPFIALENIPKVAKQGILHRSSHNAREVQAITRGKNGRAVYTRCNKSPLRYSPSGCAIDIGWSTPAAKRRNN